MITEQQDTPLQLSRLGAQRQLYATAKKVCAFQAIVSGPVAVVSSLLSMALPQTKAMVALWAVLVALADLVWLGPWQKRLRERGALVQEAFDCDVLELPWNSLKAKSRPSPELIKGQADQYDRWASTMPALNGWYAASVSELPPHLGRLACQRSNCWWDAEQRRRYATWILVCVASAFAVVLAAAVLYRVTLDDFILKVIVPLGPTLMFGLRQYFKQINAAVRLDRLKDSAEAAWKDGLAGRSPGELALQSRNLQDEIFESRRRSPFVWDWVFRALQPTYNDQMNFAVDDLVAEAHRAGFQRKARLVPGELQEDPTVLGAVASGTDSPILERK